MPESLAEAKGSRQREQPHDGEGSKYGREERGSKSGPCGDPLWNADTKDGKDRGRVLSSISKSKSARPTEMPAFSSLPSPAADSGKLAPLGVGQRSPTSQTSPRLSLRSKSPPNHRDQTLETTRASTSLSPSGSISPRSASPRLPPMKSAPSPPPSHDDASLPELGLSPRTGASSARRVRSLPPNSKRAVCGDPITHTTSNGFELAGCRGGSGSDGRFSPLLGAKEKEPRRGHSDPAVEGGARRRGRDGEEEGRARAGSRGVGVEVAEAKHDRGDVSQDRLPETKPVSSPDNRRSGRQRSSQSLSPTSDGMERSGRPGTERLATVTGGKMPRPLSSGSGNIPNGDEHRYNRRSEEKDVGSMPNSPPTARGEESTKSPRTRRMRPQRESTA